MASLLEVKGLTTRVSGFTILNNLDFSIEQNELRVLLGPNGAGKTTLISMITGQFRPVAGSIHFAGRDITGWGAPDEIFQAGDQPQIPGPQYVRNPIGPRQHYGLAAGPAMRRVFSTLFPEAERPGGESWIWEIPRIRRARGQGERPLPDSFVPWRTAMARTRHADCV